MDRPIEKGLRAQRRERGPGYKKECFFRLLFLFAAVFGVLAVGVIVVFLLAKGVPAIHEAGFFKFLFGTVWAPTHATQPQFGIFPMVVNSLYATAFALAVGGTTGVFAAIFLSRFCPKKLTPVLRQLINLLAGIPSVVYGFFGMMVLVPFFLGVSPTGVGEGMLVTAIVLGIMILPTVASIAMNSLNSVPDPYYEGAVALGATHAQAVFKVVVPAAKNGILAGLILGVGRAVGETMAVAMVCGGKPQFAGGLFTAMRTLTANIVMEMSYASGLHRDLLVASGVVLFVFVLIVTVCFHCLTNRSARGRKRSARRLVASALPPPAFRLRRGMSRALTGTSYAAISLTVLSLVGIVVFILIKGVPHLSFDLVFGSPTYQDPIHMLPSIVTTLMLIGLTLVFAVPLGVAAAIYLSEYTKRGGRLVKLIRSGVETLSGIPSIVFGLFGMLLFVDAANGGNFSIIAGCITLTLMVLPTVIRSTEEALRDVPDSYREGSLALGATKIRTIFRVVLPSAVSGIVTGVILSIGRIVGESAAVLFTVGSNYDTMPSGYGASGCSLAVLMYVWSTEGMHVNEAYAVAVVLLLLVVALNLLSTLVERKFRKKVNGNAV